MLHRPAIALTRRGQRLPSIPATALLAVRRTGNEGVIIGRRSDRATRRPRHWLPPPPVGIIRNLGTRDSVRMPAASAGQTALPPRRSRRRSRRPAHPVFFRPRDLAVASRSESE